MFTMARRRIRRRPTIRFYLITVFFIGLIGFGLIQTGHPRPAARAPHTVVPRYEWHPVALSLPYPMNGFGAVATPEGVVVAGGLVAGQSVDTVYQWTPSTIISLPNLAVPIHDAALTYRSSSLVLLGGGTVSSDNLVYRLPWPEGTEWLSLPSLPVPVSDAVAVSTRAGLLLVGGHGYGAPWSTIWRYQAARGAAVWAQLPMGIRYPAVSASPTTLYVIGGETRRGFSRQAVAFNLKNRHRIPLPPYPLAVSQAAAAWVNGRLWVVGGETASGPTDRAYQYDTETRRWLPAPALPAPRADGALVFFHNHLIWMGGLGIKGPSAGILETEPAFTGH